AKGTQQETVSDKELPRSAVRSEDEARSDHESAKDYGCTDPHAVGNPPECHGASSGAEPCKRICKRGNRARATELLGNRLEGHDNQQRRPIREGQDEENDACSNPGRTCFDALPGV